MLTALVLLCRVLLAGVFATAGFSKLASFAQTQAGLTEFGVSAGFARPFAIILITSELTVALALIPAQSAWYAAVAALTLLGFFSVVIAWNLLRGRRPSCNCFGQLHPSEIGWPTLARNAAFAVPAAAIVADPWDASTSLFTWTTAVLLGLALLAANLALLVQVLRQQGRMLMRFDGIEAQLGMHTEQPPQQHFGREPGTQAPPFELPSLDGEVVRLEQFLDRKQPTLLVFTNPDCGPCQALVPQLAAWQRDLREQLTIVMVSEGSAQANRDKFASSGITNIVLQSARETAEAYEAWGTPGAVLVAPDGRIASYLAQGADAINGLVGALQIRALPPDLTLKTRDGNELTLADLRGSPALLVFWNDACGFCQQMLPDLRGSEILLPIDENAEAATAFGAAGTPMGVLIDAQGRVASQLVAGAKEIFALIPSSNVRTEHGSLV